MKKHLTHFRRLFLILPFMMAVFMLKAEIVGNDTVSNQALSFLRAQPENIHFNYGESPELLVNSGFGYANNVWTNELYTFDPADLATASVVTGLTVISGSGDFHPDDPIHIWMMDASEQILYKIDISNGLIAENIPVPIPFDDGFWTVLSIEKSTGDFYGVATNGSQSNLYLIDPFSGISTLALELGIPAVISGTFDGAGILYLFDIALDEMWAVDIFNNTTLLLGPAGFDGNYAQGMGWDSQTNKVYLAAYNNVDGPELRLLNTATGYTTFLGELPGETTGFGFPVGEPAPDFLAAGNDLYIVPTAGLLFGEDIPPIPEGFFDPGSDPFVGRIDFKGSNSDGGQLPGQDLIINRTGDVTFSAPLPSTGDVPIEIVQLSLHSLQPITVLSGTGQTEWDVEVHLIPSWPQGGNASITKENPNGGNFDMQMLLMPELIFTDVLNPDNVRIFSPAEFGFEGLFFSSVDPLPWMAPPIDHEFDPFWEGGNILQTQAGSEMILVPLLQRQDNAFLSMDEEGVPESWEGTGFSNSEWFYYPNFNWWNVWFYDHPLALERRKFLGGIFSIMPRDPSQPSSVEVIVGWSTPQWPTWNGFPENAAPPLPGDVLDPALEEQMIERSETLFQMEGFIDETQNVTIPSDYLNNLTGLYNFNPEWIFIDVRGYNFMIYGELDHICFKPWPTCEVICPEDMEVCATDEPFALSGATPAGGIYSGNGVSADGTFDPGSAFWGNNTITYTYVCPDGTLVSCSFNIYVIPPPEMVCPPDMMVCYGDLVTLSGGMPGGGTYSGSGVTGNTFSSITSGIGSFQITYAVTNPCPGECTFYITVNPNPEVNCPSDFTMCSTDDPIDLMTLVSPQGGTFTGGNIFDPATSVGGPWQIKYTYTDPVTGCKASCVFYITVYPAPEVICPDDIVMCESDDPVDLASLGASPAGGTFRDALGNIVTAFDPTGAGPASYVFTYCYTDPQTGCEGCCEFAITVYPNPDVECPADFTMCEDDAPIDMMTLVSPQGGSFGGGQIYDPSTAPHGVPIQIKYTYTDPVTGCKSSCVFYITVYPSPDVECPEDMVACEDDFPIALTASPAGGTFSGTGISGNFFKPGDAGVGTHTIEYCYTDPQTGCEGCCEFTITVYPLPVVNCPPDMEVCVDDPAFVLTGATPAGGQYSDFAGNPMNIFNPANAGVGLFIIYYDYTDPQTGCSNYCYFTITVHPLPVVTCPPNMTVCLNDPAFALGGAVPAGGDYSDAFGVPVVNFNPAAWGVGVHTIYYDYTDPNTGCSNWCSFTITVLPLPNVTCPQDMVMCIDDGIIALAGGMPAGGTYAGPGVAGGNFNPVAAGTGVHNITYTYTDPITGCSNSCTFKITVNPLPV
ncbi:MAG: HYR domain-containing protein, partial [Bacteroidales bacterium]|nr:HYR domain-containing protein [Bacteroidales bacterium]